MAYQQLWVFDQKPPESGVLTEGIYDYYIIDTDSYHILPFRFDLKSSTIADAACDMSLGMIFFSKLQNKRFSRMLVVPLFPGILQIQMIFIAMELVTIVLCFLVTTTS